MLTILIFFLILSFLVLTHEFGHFILAKLSGVKVEEFGLGYPPRLFGFYQEKGERKWVFGTKPVRTDSTIYSINLVPFGGFNKIYGEEVISERELKDPRSFAAKPLGIRAAIVSGGVLVGILVGAAIFYLTLSFNHFTSYQSLMFGYRFPFGSQENFPMVTGVLDKSPAQNAGIVPYDLILEVEGRKITSPGQFIEIIKESDGRKIFLKLKNLKTKTTREVAVTPQFDPAEKRAVIGVGLAEIARLKYQGFSDKVLAGFLHSANLFHYSLFGLSRLLLISISRHSLSPLASQTTGVVGIFAITKLTLQEMGGLEIFNLIALLSLALAFTNLLPLPALDGGRLVLLGYEAVFKKRFPPALESKINTIGFFGIIFLSILVTYKDILQYKDILFR